MSSETKKPLQMTAISSNSEVEMKTFVVINGSRFVRPAPGSEKPEFYLEHRKSEQDYVNFLHDSQKYFHGIENGTIDINDRRYYIRGPQEYLDYHLADHIDIIDNTYPMDPVQAWFVYTQHPVQVRPYKDGYEYCGYDGRHRYEAARKHGMDLLVQVVMEE